MTDIIGEAAYRIRADTSGFQREAESGLLPAVKRIGGVLAAAFAAKEIFDFGKDAVKEAAITQKAVEGVRASFGKASAEVVKFNEDAASGFGISNAAGEKFAAQVGLITDNLGLSNSASADMVVNLEKLGGSIAAIQGTDPAATFDVLAASLQGSTRGLRSLGITISAAQVQQEAFRLGLIKTVDTALTPAQKAQAIYALETKRLGELQDQAAKHSDDLTNVTQRLGAQFDNLKESIGAALLPFIERVAIVIEQRVIPFIQEWADKITSVLVPVIDAATGFFEDHANAILDVSKAFITASGAAITLGSAFEAISLGAELLASPITIVLALGTAAVLAYQKFQAFHNIVDAAVKGVIDVLGPLASAVADAFGTINDAFEAAGRHRKFSVQLHIAWVGVKEAASELWDQLSVALLGETKSTEPVIIRGKNIQFDKSTRVEGLIERFKDAIQEVDWNKVGERVGQGIKDGILFSITDIGPGLLHAVGDALSGITIGDVFNWAEAFQLAIDDVEFFFTVTLPVAIFNAFDGSTFSWTDLWNSTLGSVDFGEVASAIGRGILSLVFQAEEQIRSGFGAIPGIVLGVLSGLPGLVTGLFSRLVSGVLGALGGLSPSTQGIFTTVVAVIVGAVAGLVPRVVGFFTNLVASSLGVLRGMISSAAGAAASIVSGIVDKFNGIGGKVADKVKSVGTSIINALQGAATSVFNAAVTLGASVIAGIVSGLSGLASAVAHKIGSALGEGISAAKGLVTGSPPGPLERAVREHITGPLAVALQSDIGLMGPGIGSALGASLGAGLGAAARIPTQAGGAAGTATSFARPEAARTATIVHVHFDDPTLKGLINVEIDESDKALADAIAAGTKQ